MNLLAPLTFADGEIGIFIRGHACAICQGHLLRRSIGSGRWIAECPNCGPIMTHNYTSKMAAERHKSGVRRAVAELAPATKRTAEEILHDLGF